MASLLSWKTPKGADRTNISLPLGNLDQTAVTLRAAGRAGKRASGGRRGTFVIAGSPELRCTLRCDAATLQTIACTAYQFTRPRHEGRLARQLLASFCALSEESCPSILILAVPLQIRLSPSTSLLPLRARQSYAGQAASVRSRLSLPPPRGASVGNGSRHHWARSP